MLRGLVLTWTVALAACGGGSSAPMAPTPPPVGGPAPPPAPVPSAVGLVVTATNGGQPLPGLAVSVDGSHSGTTDAAGQFTFSATPGVTSALLDLTGPSIVARRLSLAVRTRTAAIDAIHLTGGFSLGIYRQLVRNGFEQPQSLEPLRRWTESPRIYLRTVFGDARPIDADTLDTVAAAITSSVTGWSGGRLGVAQIDRGTDTREGVRGWITVLWTEALGDDACGRASVGANPGRIDLHPRNDRCRCPGDPGQVSRSVVIHEVGHAMGFWHTDNREDVMFDTFNACRGNLSTREVLHASVAYKRPVGNTDPDTDPATVLALAPTHIIR